VYLSEAPAGAAVATCHRANPGVSLMHHKRIKTYVILSTLTLAGCGEGVRTDRTFPVFFDNASATLDEPARDIVIGASNVARQSPLAAVTVEGYADDMTSRADDHLSTNRANAVTASLVAHGINASRVTSIRNGIDRTSSDGEDGISGRRVDIAIQYPSGKP
jgi:outer membrane protein OmpA-like peptidoglycan-associated protein